MAAPTVPFVLVLALTAFGAACASRPPIEPSPREDREMMLLRDEVRAMAATSCGQCHDGARATAKPAALRIFDLREQEWTAHMDARQLSAFRDRISKNLDELQKLALERYLSGELARRAPTRAE